MSTEKLKETALTYHAEEFRSEFQPLIDELYREEVLDARKMPMEEKFLLGEQLFRWACQVTLAGIRNQNPGVNEQECQRILVERIELGKKMGTL
ncbi:MAG TPA: hypothetical protein VHC44_10045 [Verrucomicrobiae bacterium]|nr:hypothetical protein [Verrucomicrobiae bacterium]